ncbi:upstream activation factor subunit UAF30-like [Vicia villosa]|uniref:upstream activation factor subunit UAF30-like n=1 Tax=Vicia villosa TaxID=3911 RepID=UPI00273B2B70|nr:upstream activation factor subunit UAF30-like [Vicia villosa]
MVSESELIGRIREFLGSSDLTTTTTTTVRRQLESDFGIDLSDRKAFIREQVDSFLQSVNQPQEEDEPQNDDVVEDADKPEPSQGSGSREENEEEEVKEDGDNEEEEEAEEKPRRTRSANKKKKNTKSKKRSNKSGDEVVKKKGGNGFCRICSLSPQLQEFTGAPEMARTEVVKQLWAYIREKNLQDPNNRRNINCDEPLRALFGVNSINMFQMNKVLAKHIWPLDSDDVIQVNSTPKEKQKKQKREDDVIQVKSTPKEKKKKKQKREDDDEPKGKEKRQKGGSGKGFLAPLQLSDALAKFLGESELSRSDVIKRMWDYIKGNNLQDPSDKRQIICDEKLKELFDVDSFNGFTVTKLLVPHFIKT